VSHSRKILGQAGVSLADVYDIEGSVVGLENLDVSEVKAVHDLGGQIHSERLISFIVLSSSGAVNQSAAIGVTAGGIPDSVNRLLGVSVLASAAARVDHVALTIQDADTGREFPIWSWDTNDDREQQILWSLDGAGAAAFFLLSTLVTQLPQLLTRLGTSLAMPQLVMRGTTSAFGAGTVTVRALYHLCRPNTGNPTPGEPSSHGLPLPGW